MKNKFTAFTTKEIEPKGWLLDQLKIQANGLSGNLDKIWPDVRDSKWIGGDKEGWERVPYWLDGFIPLAYLLKDEDMIARAQRYVDAILDGQCEDGWICPCSHEERDRYDMWALFLILKVLIVYHDCTNDSRIEGAVEKALYNYYQFNHNHTPYGWAHARWYECVISIAWLYERKPLPWLADLAQLLEAQGMDYLRAPRTLKKEAESWNFYAHIVNLAMALKSDAVMTPFDGRAGGRYASKLLKILLPRHGNVNGYFNGDECLATSSPSRGTELCGVAEAMYSYEVITLATGEPVWMDKCERLAFNALPATISEDMWTHQYDQMSNQPNCVNYNKPEFKDYKGKAHFNTNGTESHLFGLEPNFGCCTANMNQAFPKFVLSCFAKSQNGIVVSSLAPCSVRTEIDGVPVTVTTETLYPFRDDVTVNVQAEKPVSFTLSVRIPGFVDGATVNGEQAEVGKYCELVKEWTNDTVKIQLSSTAKLVKRGTLVAAVKGALTYSLPVAARSVMREYVKDGVERKFPYCDYELYADSEWQVGFASSSLEYAEKSEYVCAFSTQKPLCVLKASVAPIEWGGMKGTGYTVPRSTPKSRVPKSEAYEVELIPYGCAKLRMTELPLL